MPCARLGVEGRRGGALQRVGADSVPRLEPGSEIFLELLSWENRLANELFQENPEELDRCLHPDFLEVETSGEVVDRNAAIRWILAREHRGAVSLMEPSVSDLGDGWFLVRYRSRSGSGKLAHRISLWKRKPEGDCSLRYHQGTPIPFTAADQRAP